jgi:hypothetical protein
MRRTLEMRNTLMACGCLALAILACALPGAGTAPADEGDTAPVAEAPVESTQVPESQPQPAAAGQCDNPLLPVRDGATWNFNLTDSEGVHTFTRTLILVNSDSFHEQDVYSTGTIRTNLWECENGALISLNPVGGASGSISAEGMTFEYETVDRSGVTVPAVVNSGDTWSQSITLEGNNTISGLSTQERNEYMSTCTADGMETVTVPAGTFEALRFICEFNMLITVEVSGFSPAPIQMNGTTISWLAPGIGWIKSVSSGENLDNIIELTSYSIP